MLSIYKANNDSYLCYDSAVKNAWHMVNCHCHSRLYGEVPIPTCILHSRYSIPPNSKVLLLFPQARVRLLPFALLDISIFFLPHFSPLASPSQDPTQESHLSESFLFFFQPLTTTGLGSLGSQGTSLFSLPEIAYS